MSLPSRVSRLDRRAAVSPTVVLPTRLQSHGDVLALLEAAIQLVEADAGAEPLDQARSLGEELVLVEGVPAYYPRFGFVRARSLGIEPPWPVPDAAWMALPLTDEPRDWSGRAVLSRAFDHLAPH